MFLEPPIAGNAAGDAVELAAFSPQQLQHLAVVLPLGPVIPASPRLMRLAEQNLIRFGRLRPTEIGKVLFFDHAASAGDLLHVRGGWLQVDEGEHK